MKVPLVQFMEQPVWGRANEDSSNADQYFRLSRLRQAQNHPRRIKCHQREYSGSKALEVGRLCGVVLC